MSSQGVTEVGAGGVSGGSRVLKRDTGMGLEMGAVELLGPVADTKPVREYPNKGKTKYPFEQLEVGHGMRVKRAKTTIKGAVRRWKKAHKAQRFEVWNLGGGWTMVKRIK